jgi:DNA-binding transcriptional ArsR family regulator
MSTASRNIDTSRNASRSAGHGPSGNPAAGKRPAPLAPSTGVRSGLVAEVWPAADLSMSLLATVHRSVHRSLAVRDLWRTRAAALDGEFLAALDHYGKETWINLLGLPLDRPDARSAGGFAAVVASMDPLDLLRYLSGYFRRVFRRETPAAVMDAAIGGDDAARREFRRTSFPDDVNWRDTLRYLLAHDPAAIQAEFAGLVGRWQREVYGPLEEGLVAEMDAGLHTFANATDGQPLEQIVERAVPGVTYVPEADQTSVVLLPSIAIRPVWAVADHRTANVFAFPAPDPEGRGATPPARLVALGRAIGDETRLRILRELATHPATPPDLADRMGIPRTTLLHHLRILRDADLIAVQVHDSAYHQYHVRDEQFGEIERMLEAYLG